MATYTYNIPGTYDWTCPANVHSVNVICIGGGSGGGVGHVSGGEGIAGGGAGGGAGGYGGSVVSVTPGTIYQVVVGAGGAGGTKTSLPGDGENSSFDACVASGGYWDITDGVGRGRGGSTNGDPFNVVGGDGGLGGDTVGGGGGSYEGTDGDSGDLGGAGAFNGGDGGAYQTSGEDALGGGGGGGGGGSAIPSTVGDGGAGGHGYVSILEILDQDLVSPSASPSSLPSPSASPSSLPSSSASPSVGVLVSPSESPSSSPSESPSESPSSSPSESPSESPSSSPSESPSSSPSESPSESPSSSPSESPSSSPSMSPSASESPSASPSIEPVRDWYFVADGGIEVYGDSEFDFTFIIDIDFRWSFDSVFVNEIDFLWNTGDLPSYWYRVIGKCRAGDACNLIADPCLQKFIVNIHARSITELCEKLSSRNINLPVQSIQKFSTPLIGTDVSKCTTLEDVPFCQVPACIDFCLDYDIVLSFGGSIVITPTGNEFTYESDGLYITINGSSTCSFEDNISSYEPHPESCYVVIEGESDYKVNPIVVQLDGGGIKLTGSYLMTAEDWSFGGEDTMLGTGIKSPANIVSPVTLTAPSGSSWRTPKLTSGGKEWEYLENLNTFGNAQVDVSELGTSDIILLNDFNLNIPQNCRILDVSIYVSRSSNCTSIYDDLVCLTNGLELYSRADRNEYKTRWPFGGSTDYVYTKFVPWVGSWDIDVFNSSDFGVAFRVKEKEDTARAIAYLDYVRVQVFYEYVAVSSIIVDGSSDCMSNRLKFTASGDVAITGTYSFRRSYKFAAFTRPISITIGGGSEVNFVFEIDSGINISGESTCVYDDYCMHNGVRANGMAEVKPFWDIMQGGIKNCGVADVAHHTSFEISGEILVQGSSRVGVKTSVGGTLQISGNARIVSEKWYFTAYGGIIIDGYGDNIPGNTVVPSITFNGDMLIQSFDGYYADEAVTEFSPTLTTVSRCGCTEIPDTIQLAHNLNRDNILSKFLERNNLSLDRVLYLYFNSVNNCWQHNSHFVGYSSNANEQESWDFVFSVQCGDTMGGTDIGMDVWKISTVITRKNLSTNEAFNTHICFAIYPRVICSTSASQLDVSFIHDVQLGTTLVKPSDVIIYQLIMFDNIGIFKSLEWASDPDLRILVSQSGIPPTIQRYDFKDSAVPQDLIGTMPGS